MRAALKQRKGLSIREVRPQLTHACHQDGSVTAPPMPSTPAAAIMVPYCERKLGGSEGDLGPLRRVCISPSDTVSSSRALAWCQDPRLTGTFAISVVTPSATCSAAEDYVAACLSSFGFANVAPGE